MNKQRRHFPDPDQAAILRRHFIDQAPVANLCDELDLHPTPGLRLVQKVLRERRQRFAKHLGRRPERQSGLASLCRNLLSLPKLQSSSPGSGS